MPDSINSYKQGLKNGIPIGLGYLSVSFTFGMMAVSSGLSIPAALAISMTCLTSAGQFAGIAIIAAGSSFVEMILTQLVINIRYALMSVSLSQKADESLTTPHRLMVSFAITDEVFAVASSKPCDVGRRYMYGLITVPYIGWSLGTLLGALVSGILPSSLSSALSIAIYGMFIAIIIPPAKKSKAILYVIIAAAALSALFRYLPLFSGLSGGFAIIICAVAASAFGAIFFPIKKEEYEQ